MKQILTCSYLLIILPLFCLSFVRLKKTDPPGLCKIIPASNYKSALSSTKEKKIILNLYPIKYSNDPEKNDFDAIIYYQNNSGKEIRIQNINAEFRYEPQIRNYVAYLKNHDVKLQDIPEGYYLTLDQKDLRNIDALKICISLPDGRMTCYKLSNGVSKEAKGRKKNPEDSTGKCPPLCKITTVFEQDSTGKCPPQCLQPLVYRNAVKKIIATVFKP